MRRRKAKGIDYRKMMRVLRPDVAARLDGRPLLFDHVNAMPHRGQREDAWASPDAPESLVARPASQAVTHGGATPGVASVSQRPALMTDWPRRLLTHVPDAFQILNDET